MYDGVPTVAPVTVSPCASATLAIPKSVTTAQQGGGHHLDSDLAVQGDVVGQVHGCHAAPSELPQDLVLAQRGLSHGVELGRLQCGRGRRSVLVYHGRRNARLHPGDVRATAGAEAVSGSNGLAATRAGGGESI